ncbi:hypothetical protein CEQ90_11365 [Lewinellaceae bacterium SD302]|nr:hypothetical protein CEQ90_11365 [Lewinellaceae bacterium SD302]
MDKRQLKEKVARGRVKEVLDELLAQTEGMTIHNDLLQLTSRFNRMAHNRRNGTVNPSTTDITENQITQALLGLIDELEELNLPSERLVASRTSSSRRPAAAPTAWWPYVVKIGVVVAIVAGIVATLKHLGYLGEEGGPLSRSMTVLVHSPEGKDKLVLPNRGRVYLIYGEAKVGETINAKGEATFKQINEAYFKEDARVELLFEDPEGEPYRARFPDSAYQLKAGQYLSLEVVLEGMETVEGIVKDFVSGAPLDSVEIRIPGQSFFTNAYGEFSLDLPPSRQSQFIDFTLTKEGYQRKELTQVPTTTEQFQRISMKPE